MCNKTDYQIELWDQTNWQTYRGGQVTEVANIGGYTVLQT